MKSWAIAIPCPSTKPWPSTSTSSAPWDRKELDPFLRKKDFKGLNVTIPYKQAVLPYLDGISPEAEDVGSVNTIVKQKDGRLLGYNTDLYGMEYMARLLGVPLRGKKVLVLGSGRYQPDGPRHAAPPGRGPGAGGFPERPLTYEGLEAHRDAQILINTTPVGMYPGQRRKPRGSGALSPAGGRAGRHLQP